jgi:hypothetical protein
MKKEYNFSKLKELRSPYPHTKKAVGINLSPEVLDYFKALAAEAGVPYQKLIDLYLLDCARKGKKLRMKWVAWRPFDNRATYFKQGSAGTAFRGGPPTRNHFNFNFRHNRPCFTPLIDDQRSPIATSHLSFRPYPFRHTSTPVALTHGNFPRYCR